VSSILFPSFFILFAYLCGSISSAVLICKLWKLPDPRTTGSNNPGTTNVLRLGGKLPALFTLILDAFKGFFPVLLARLFGLESFWLSCIAFAAVVGHLFPVFFGFRGGKGVATYLGAVFALSWILGLMVGITWVVMAALFRYSSLAALIAIFFAPLEAFFLGERGPFLWPFVAMTLLVILRHHENIRRLLSGKESRIGEKK